MTARDTADGRAGVAAAIEKALDRYPLINLERGEYEAIAATAAEAALASGLVVSREAYDDMKRSLGRAADARDRLAAQVAAVRAIHHEAYPGAGWCAECNGSPNEAWPCDTIRALAADQAPTTEETDRGCRSLAEGDEA